MSIMSFDNITNLRQHEGMTEQIDPTLSGDQLQKNMPEAILRDLKELDGDLYHLNDRYGLCVGVTPRNGQEALQRHLLERSDDYLRTLYNDIFRRLDTVDASPSVMDEIQKVSREVQAKLGEWYDKYHSCISSERYDDDLGIQARRIVLELQAKLEFVL